MKKTLLILLLLSSLSFGRLHAQSFDGPGDEKLMLSVSLHRGNRFGAEYTRLSGISNVFSYGYLLGYHFYKSDRYGFLQDVNNMTASMLVRFNTTNLLNISEKFNYHITLGIGLLRLTAHTGFTYMFTERIGLDVDFAYPLTHYFFKEMIEPYGYSVPYGNLSLVINLQ
ncbi:MAG: hypothetical protein GXO24_03170 [Chlorobi bacterium]|nr:hypothetical protein [Chlorobiota bacterium]